jgi:hypothetical protein
MYAILYTRYILNISYNTQGKRYSTGSSSRRALKLNGSNATPSPMKCLLIASTQCRRSECNMALVPSMTQRTMTVNANQKPKTKTIKTEPIMPVYVNAFFMVISHRTIERR